MRLEAATRPLQQLLARGQPVLERARGVAERVHAVVGAALPLRPLEVLLAPGTAEFLARWRQIPPGPTLVARLYALHQPDRDALVDDTGRLTWREFDESLNAIGNGLAALGVRSGDRVAVMMRNCRQYVQAQWAIARMGAVLVQIGYRLKAGEVAHVLGNSEAAAVLYHADYRDIVAEACRMAGVTPHLVRVPDELERTRLHAPPGPRAA